MSREPIKSSLDHETVAAGEESLMKIQKNPMSHIQIKLYSVVYVWHVGKAVYCCAHAVQ